MPGKFSDSIASYLYALSLDGGADEECGSSSEGSGWYGLLDFTTSPVVPTQDDIAEHDLTDDDCETLASASGAILFESTDGFVDASIYTDRDAMNEVWEEIEDSESQDDEIDD